jgi:ClpP class serine protease
MVAGCQETADVMFKAKKPSISVVDANCYSAAYMLASQTGRIVVTPTGGTGSIGVVLMHLDVSKALEEAGLKVTFVYAGSHKVDGNPYEPLSPEVEADFQADIDACYDAFVATVIRGRDMTDSEVRDTEARMYRAEDALALGLIDAVQNPDDAVEAFFADASDAGVDDNDPPEPEENAMPPVNRSSSTAPAASDAAALAAAEQARVDAETASAQAAAAAASTAAAAARTAERERIAGIQGHVEAVGREALAAYLALQTDMSVEVASGILAASPKAAAAPALGAEEPNHFQNAMDRDRHPNVGAGSGAAEGEGDDDGMTPAQRILASQRRVTGYKPPNTTH